MKKALVITLVALFAFGGVAYAINQPSDIGVFEGVGTKATPLRVFILVRNPMNYANGAYVGFQSSDVLVWDTISDDGITVNGVSSTDITTSTDAVAGVCVGGINTADASLTSAADDMWKDNWGYVQVYGKALAKVDATNISVGEGLRASATSGRACGDGNDALGFALDASASSASTIEVFVRCR